MNSYLEGSLVSAIQTEVETTLRDELAGLQPEEAAVLGMLQARLKRSAKPPKRSRRAKARVAPRKARHLPKATAPLSVAVI
jgi:DNA topoisomerase-1